MRYSIAGTATPETDYNPIGESIVIQAGSATATVTIESDELLSDLDITFMSTPTTAGAGQSIVITDTTKNIGGGVSDPSLAQFYLSTDNTIDTSDTLLGSRNVPALAPGAYSYGSTTVTIPESTAAGNWYIVAKADAEEIVPETSETNNTYARSININ